MINTTLTKIRDCHPCEDSWVQLLAGLGKTKADDDPLPMTDILRICGLADCLWATRSLPEHDKTWRLLACDYADNMLHLFEDKYPDDSRPRDCIAVSRRFALGDATSDELEAARGGAAWAAADAWAAGAVGDTRAARAAWAARDAGDTGGALAARDTWAARAAWAARATWAAWAETRLVACLEAGEWVAETPAKEAEQDCPACGGTGINQTGEK